MTPTWPSESENTLYSVYNISHEGYAQNQFILEKKNIYYVVFAMVYDEFKTFQINQLSVPLLDINMLYKYICMNYFCIFLF